MQSSTDLHTPLLDQVTTVLGQVTTVLGQACACQVIQMFHNSHKPFILVDIASSVSLGGVLSGHATEVGLYNDNRQS